MNIIIQGAHNYMSTSTSIIQRHNTRFAEKQVEKFILDEYLDRCRQDELYYAPIHKRLRNAIGKSRIVDTSQDERLSRIFSNRKIKEYPESFGNFFGIESVIERLVGFLEKASQGLEESRQILYLRGPVGSSKSSLAETIKALAQKNPFYSIEALNKQTGKVEISPLFESPLGLIDYEEDAAWVEKQYKIPARYLKFIMSPWAVQRLRESNGDLGIFTVVKLWPSILNQVGITKVEPGDDNNTDITTLVGKLNINKLGKFDENNPDAYAWSGGLNVTTQGVLDFPEMLKAPIKVLNPLLTTVQEGHYNGSQQFGASPYQGLIFAHSNLNEFKNFKNDKKNEAFFDRIHMIDVPYNLRVSEEKEIYKKIIGASELKDAPCAPGTYEMLAQYSVLSRIKNPENSSPFLKMEVYDGKNIKAKHPSVKSMEEYRNHAGVDEGMDGSSTRQAYQILSSVYNFDVEEKSANPIHLLQVLEHTIKNSQLPADEEKIRLGFVSEFLRPKYADFLRDEIQKAYIENHDAYCQNLYERYIAFADNYIDEKDYPDPDTGLLMSREVLNKELEKIEKAAEISNPKEFRNEVVKFSLRSKAKFDGKMPRWDAYEKIKEVIEKKVFSNFEELLPVITSGKKSSEEEQNKHNKFIERFQKRGYTLKMTKLLIDWFIQAHKNS